MIASPAPELASELAPALAFGRFRWRLRRRLGEGASGVVYEADGEGERVALKVAHGREPWVGREAAVLARVHRRWGPSLVDAGVVPEGVADPSGIGLPAGAHYIAMTFCEGQSLAELRSAGTAGERAILAAIVAHGVARGLDELHALGVRHGDVKPSNVLVAPTRPTRDLATDRGAVLLDLDLAANFGDALAGGTPRYLAPELASGEPSPAADLYALGIVLAEIVAPSLLTVDDVGSALSGMLGDGGLALEREIGAWIAALVARAPGARPSASWIAARASRWLELAADHEENVAARRAHVRRSYLAVRAPRITAHACPDSEIDGAPRAWLEEAVTIATRLEGSGVEQGAPVSVERTTLSPLSSFDVQRWLVHLVGSAAAAWPVPSVAEGELAARLLDLAASAPPEAWTYDDVVGRASPQVASAIADTSPDDPDRWLTLARALQRSRPDGALLDRIERDVESANAPIAIAIDLAAAFLRRGEIGRAFAAISVAPSSSAEASVLRAEIQRRRGDPRASELASTVALASSSTEIRDAARAIQARLAWDAGDLARAEASLVGARSAPSAEVRGLVAYARGEHDRGIEIVSAALLEAGDDLGRARLEGTLGMLEHARGDASASLAAFERASDLATRTGAVVEEASYLTGLAAAAVDAGAVARALPAATRAALLWERLGRPGLSARALLSRAAAFSLVGASHDADEAAALARSAALASRDARAAAFARWAIVETRAPGDSRAREEALAADEELAQGSDDDRVRSAARVLLWGGGAASSSSFDEKVAGLAAATRWEWWGARAATAEPSTRTLSEIVALLDVPAPLASRGPALAAGVRLARELGSGDAARRIETARVAAAAALRRGAPASHRASVASVGWAASSSHLDESSRGLGGAQVEQLEAIVRALSSRDRLKPLLEQVLDTMVLWTGVERGLLLLRAPDGGLVVRAARNLARHDLIGEQLALSMGLAKRATAERQMVVATDAFAQVGDLHASVHALRLRSVLAVPLVARGDVLGAVYLDDRVRRGAFGPGELSWVRLVASQAALAIADARDQVLLRRAVRRAERANARLQGELGAREAELVAIRAELASGEETRFRYDEIAGRSEPMRAMLRLVDRVTASDVPVLLVGESGTGKELVARAIHANGPRGKRAFVSENCGAVPEALLESTLFGHVRGAFTGASATRAGLFDVADRGTLFLDEIGEMPLSMQAKLLRVLQDGEVRPVGSERSRTVDVRVVGATHRDLEAMVAAGTFREDLFYRLNVVSLRVPPLRERREDIPLLVSRFLDKHAGDKKIKVTRAALDRLSAFPWPGNVRQLENEVRRAIVLADERIDVAELSEEVARGGPAAARDAGLGLKARVDALETELVRDALVRTKGNQTRAAETLGVSRFGLQKMMRRLGLR